MVAGREDDAFPQNARGSPVWAEVRHPRKRAMLAALARTGNVSAASRAAGVARRTHYDWTRTDPAYAAAVLEAMDEAIEVLEAVARRRAINGSDTMLIFLLKSLRPERYRERYEVRHEGSIKAAKEVREQMDRIFSRPDVLALVEKEYWEKVEAEDARQLPPPMKES